MKGDFLNFKNVFCMYVLNNYTASHDFMTSLINFIQNTYV